MRQPGDILLVATYELGHQPLSLASATAFLRRAGFAPACVDLSLEKLDAAALARARLVAIAVPMHTAVRLGARVAERVRRVSPGAHVAFFGLYAPLGGEALVAANPDATLLGGEAEEDLVALATSLEAGAAIQHATSLRRLPFLPPERDGLPALGRYAHLVLPTDTGEEHRVAGYVEATRGCLHMCRHCPIPPVYGGRFFAVPAEIVLEDARRQVELGARHITFGDPDFLNGPRHGLAVARGLHAIAPDVTFDFTSKVEHLLRHADVLPELASLGAIFVVSAVESLSDRVLEILDKGHTAADVPRALALVRAAGLTLRPTFVAFTPWTSLEDYLALCRFVVDEDLVAAVDPVQLSLRLLVPPGSLLLAHAPEAFGPLDPERFTFTWTHPDPRLDRLQADVTRLVEEASGRHEPAAGTFAAIHALAAGVAGLSTPPPPLPGRKAPRLSEPWFC